MGYFGEHSSKIIKTSILGELKLEIILTSQIASCILGSSVPGNVPVYPQAAATFDNQFVDASVKVVNDVTDESSMQHL